MIGTIVFWLIAIALVFWIGGFIVGGIIYIIADARSHAFWRRIKDQQQR